MASKEGQDVVFRIRRWRPEFWVLGLICSSSSVLRVIVMEFHFHVLRCDSVRASYRDPVFFFRIRRRDTRIGGVREDSSTSGECYCEILLLIIQIRHAG